MGEQPPKRRILRTGLGDARGRNEDLRRKNSELARRINEKIPDDAAGPLADMAEIVRDGCELAASGSWELGKKVAEKGWGLVKPVIVSALEMEIRSAEAQKRLAEAKAIASNARGENAVQKAEAARLLAEATKLEAEASKVQAEADMIREQISDSRQQRMLELLREFHEKGIAFTAEVTAEGTLRVYAVNTKVQEQRLLGAGEAISGAEKKD